LLQKSKKKLILSFIELKIVELNFFEAMLFDFTFLFAITLKVAFVRPHNLTFMQLLHRFSNGLHSLYILINFRFFNSPQHLDDVINGEFMQVEFNQICEFFKPHPFFDETTFKVLKTE